MEGILTNESSFKEIKQFFVENESLLPKTLGAECKYYRNVQYTIEVYFGRIESESKRLGKDIKKSVVAKSAKRNLYQLYLDLKNVDGWDAEMPKLCPFSNKM